MRQALVLAAMVPVLLGALFHPAAQSSPRSVAATPALSSSTAAGHLSASDAALAEFFDGYIADTIERLDLPGGAVVVVRGGRTILAKGYGQADLRSRRRVSVEDTIFRLASVSKTFTWLLAMQLVEEGRLDLDADVDPYLGFEIPTEPDRPITMRHLMTHTAGFADRFWGVYEPDTKTPLGQILKENIPARVYVPGSTIAYSNYGAALAAYILERLRGQPFERLIAEKIYAPMEMRRSTFAQPIPEPLRPLLASNYPHGSEEPSAFQFIAVPPAGSMSASPGDMARFLTMLLNGGQGARGRVLSASTLESMFSLHKPLAPGLASGLGLGFFVGEHRGVRYAGHAGNLGALATDIEVLPAHGLGWYYVFNGEGPEGAARGVRLNLLTTVIDRFVASERPLIRAQLPSAAEDAAGKYLNTRRPHAGPLLMTSLMDTADVEARDDGTVLISVGPMTTEWLPAGRDRFVEKETGIPLAITRGPDGAVVRLASALLHPAAEFEPTPEYTKWARLVALFSLPTLVLAVLLAPFVWGFRRWRPQPNAPSAGVSAVPAPLARLRPLARVSFWMLISTTVGWLVFLVAMEFDAALVFTAPALLRVILGLMTLLSAPVAGIMLLDAVIGLRDPERGWATRVAKIPMAVAAVGMAWLFYTFDMINFSTNW